MAKSDRSSLLRRIPFLDEDEPPHKRANVDTGAVQAARAREGERILALTEAALADFYRLTKRDWINRYWHSALVHADVAAKHAVKQPGCLPRLRVAFEAAVHAECRASSDEIARILADAAGDALAASQAIIVLLRNFVYRTREHIQAVPVIDLLYFRPVVRQTMLEFALHMFSESVITHDLSFTLATQLLEGCRLNFAMGFTWTMAFLALYNEPGMGQPRATPWRTILDELWERECEENRGIVRHAAADPAVLAEPRALVSHINGWILNILRSAAYAFRLVVAVRESSKNQSIDLQEKAWLDRLANTASQPYAVWAEYALIAARDPVVTDATSGMMRNFFRDENHDLWLEKEWPALFRVVVGRIAGLCTNSIARFDVAWRVLQVLSLGVSRAKERRFRDTYFEVVYEEVGARFYADLYWMLVRYRVGEPGAPSDPELDLDGGLGDGRGMEREAEREIDEAVLGSRTRLVEVNEERLRPMPAKISRKVLSAVLFARDLDIFDTGRFESELYMEIARCHLPRPLGRGIPRSPALLRAFNELTRDEYHHVRTMTNEIESQRTLAPNQLVLNSGNWMSSVDPYLSNEVEPAVLQGVVHPRADELTALSNLADGAVSSPSPLRSASSLNHNASVSDVSLNSNVPARSSIVSMSPLSSLPPRSDRPNGGRAGAEQDSLTGDASAEKIYKWHRTWSWVTCELNGGRFTCSWLQLEFVQALLESAEPLSEKRLVGEVMLEEFAAQCLHDLAAHSNGFVKQARVDNTNYYAIDSGVVPSGNWVQLQFADEWQ